MRKTLTIAAALVAMAAAFAAVAAGGTHSPAQRVRIEVKGTDPFTFVLTPVSEGGTGRDTGPMTFCCWHDQTVIRAGAKLDVTNPRLTLVGTQGTLKIGSRIEWVALPDGWQVWTGTWKVVAGTGAYAGLSGHGSEAGAWEPEATTPDRHIRIRLFGFLGPK
jgi:hypothetical protein